MAQDMFRPRTFYNDRDQEVRDDHPYAAITKAVVEIVQSGNFLGPVESNGGFTQNGVAISGGSYTHPNHTGDVTSTGDGATVIGTDKVLTAMILDDNVTEGKIADEAVTNAKLAHMAQSTFKGRDKAAGTGDATDLSRAQAVETLRGGESVSTGATTYSIDTDAIAYYRITGQTATITDIAVTGTPVEGQTLWISITGTTAVLFTLNAGSFEDSTISLPTTTVSTDRLDMGFVYNSATSSWRIVAEA